MKSIGRDDRVRRKYQKKEEYLLHFQLFDGFLQSIAIIIPVTLFWFIGVYFVNGGYPPNIGALDTAFFVLSLGFIFYFKPRILKGKIKAYYRRDYNDIRYLLLVAIFVIQGAILRFPIFMGLYALNWKLAETASVKANYLRQMRGFLFDPKMTLIAVLFFAVTMYFTFYSEKYVTIKEFSNSVVGIMRKNGISEDNATMQFIGIKDKYYEIDKFENVKYDNDEKSEPEANSHKNKYNKEKKEENKEDNIIRVGQVRRKSRRL